MATITRVTRDFDGTVVTLPLGDFDSLEEAQEEISDLSKKYGHDSEFVIKHRDGGHWNVIHRGKVLGDWNDPEFGEKFSYADLLTQEGK